MGITLPMVRHVVDVGEDHAQQLLRAEHQVLVGDKGPGETGPVRRGTWSGTRFPGAVGGRDAPSSCTLCPGAYLHTVTVTPSRVTVVRTCSTANTSSS